MNKQKLTLFILLILFALAILWSFFSFPRQKTVPTLTNQPGQKAKNVRIVSKKNTPPQPSVKSDERVLLLDLLNQENTPFKGYKRNIFKPIFVDELTLIKQKVAMNKTVMMPSKPVLPTKPVNQEIQVAKPEAPRTPLAHFIFLGFLKKDNKQTIFISKDKEILLVKQGERFAQGKYEVTSLTEQALSILVVETGEEIVVPLLENKPLIAAKK